MGPDRLAAGHIPNLDLAWPTGSAGKRRAGQAFAVRAEGHALDTACVPFAGQDLLATGRVPHLNKSTAATRSTVSPRASADDAREPFAVGSEGHFVDAVGEVLEQSPDFLAGGGVPDAQRARPINYRGQFAVGSKNSLPSL